MRCGRVDKEVRSYLPATRKDVGTFFVVENADITALAAGSAESLDVPLRRWLPHPEQRSSRPAEDFVEDAMAESLRHWESFYVIVGSSGAALTGLQFVVVALVSEVRRGTTTEQIDAFATPTIVHFSAVLLVAAVLSAPWHALSGAAVALGACGAAGMGYTAIVLRRARRQTGYRVVLEDWLWHTAFPFVAYATLLSAAFPLARHAGAALFTIAAATLLLLFIGIHNAWDTAAYLVVERLGRQEKEDR